MLTARQWGLTLGVMTDLLDLLPPHNARALWQYPSFTAPDVAAILSILGARTRRSVDAVASVDVAAGKDGPLDFVGRAIDPWYLNVPVALASALGLRVLAVVAVGYGVRKLLSVR